MLSVRLVSTDQRNLLPVFMPGNPENPATLSKLQAIFVGYTVTPDDGMQGCFIATEHEREALPDLIDLMAVKHIVIRTKSIPGLEKVKIAGGTSDRLIYLNTIQSERLAKGLYPYVQLAKNTEIVFLRNIASGDNPATRMDVYVTLDWLGIPPRTWQHRLCPWRMSYEFDGNVIVIHHGLRKEPIVIPFITCSRRTLHHYIIEAIFADGRYRRGLPVEKKAGHIPGIGVSTVIVDDEERVYVDGLYLCSNDRDYFTRAWEQYARHVREHYDSLEVLKQEQ